MKICHTYESNPRSWFLHSDHGSSTIFDCLEVESETFDPQARAVRATLYRDKLFSALFLLHIAAVTTGIVYLGVKSIIQKDHSKIHDFKRWYAPLWAGVVVAGAFGCACQIALKLKPRKITEVVLWTNAVLTISAAVMLLATGISRNLALGALLIIFAIAQSLYSCWVSRRLKYAGDILSVSLAPANKFSGIYLVSNCILIVASFWLSLWIFGLVGALRHSFSSLIILVMLGSLAWTMEVLRNIVHGTVAMVVAQVYLDGSSPTQHSVKSSLHRLCTSSFGSICLGSLIVPILHVLRMTARGLSRTQGENEFMFSCADCFMGVMDTLIGFGNNWAYVQVVVYGKPFIKASQDTWDLIKNRKLDVLINTDLTSSVCVLSGISGGMLCVLVSGGWIFAIHKGLTTTISILAFIIGYSMVRIAMAVPQGSVAVHYVCYAENPTNQQLMQSPISERLKEVLQALA